MTSPKVVVIDADLLERALAALCHNSLLASEFVASLPVSTPVGWARESTLLERVFRAPTAPRDGKGWYPVYAHPERKT